MDEPVELWLAFVSIAFLIETSILIGRYINLKTLVRNKFSTLLYFLCLSLVIALSSGILAGWIFKIFEKSAFNLTIIFIVWIPLYYPIYYSIYRMNDEKIDNSVNIKCKEYNEITPEDTIIINHLIDTHNRVFSDIDALDTKIAQVIALNGVIISLVFIRSGNQPVNNLIILGLAIIVSSMAIGIFSFYPRDFFVGPHHSFYKKYDTHGGISTLINKLTEHYPKNLREHNKKADLFRYMLVALLIGLIILIVSLCMQTL